MKNIININVVACIMQGLGMGAHEVVRLLQYATLEALMASDDYFLSECKTIATLVMDDLLTDDLFTKIRSIITGNYSYCTTLREIKKDKNGNAYLVFNLDFDEHYDYFYLDLQTGEEIGNQSDFIDYLLNR